MAVYSVDDFVKKIGDKIVDNDDLAIELMEDVKDSFSSDTSKELEDMRKLVDEKDADIERAKSEIDDLKAKYKERFMSPAVESRLSSIDERVPEEVQERKIIDVRVI